MPLRLRKKCDPMKKIKLYLLLTCCGLIGFAAESAGDTIHGEVENLGKVFNDCMDALPGISAPDEHITFIQADSDLDKDFAIIEPEVWRIVFDVNAAPFRWNGKDLTSDNRITEVLYSAFGGQQFSLRHLLKSSNPEMANEAKRELIHLVDKMIAVYPISENEKEKELIYFIEFMGYSMQIVKLDRPALLKKCDQVNDYYKLPLLLILSKLGVPDAANQLAKINVKDRDLLEVILDASAK